MPPERELTPRQIRAVSAILEADTRADAARQAGVSERTLRRWANLDPFRAEVRRQRSRVLDSTASILAGGSARCAAVLIQVATTGGGPLDAVRVSAARAVLDAATKAEELSTVTARLDELEASFAAQPKTGGTRWA